MLVRQILDAARQRLAILSWDAPVIAAAEILANPNTPLIVVCDSMGVAIGVITRMDLVKRFSAGPDEAFAANAGDVMTQPVFSCHEDERLQFVWDGLSARQLRCVPVLDDSRRPSGVAHAREIVSALLEEVTHEELLLRDYVLGIGYR